MSLPQRLWVWALNTRPNSITAAPAVSLQNRAAATGGWRHGDHAHVIYGLWRRKVSNQQFWKLQTNEWRDASIKWEAEELLGPVRPTVCPQCVSALRLWGPHSVCERTVNTVFYSLWSTRAAAEAQSRRMQWISPWYWQCFLIQQELSFSSINFFVSKWVEQTQAEEKHWSSKTYTHATRGMVSYFCVNSRSRAAGLIEADLRCGEYFQLDVLMSRLEGVCLLTM